MTKVLYFNRETLEQLFLDDEQHRNQAREFEEKGWLANPPLVHIYSEQRRDHKIVHADDCRQWEERGYYRSPTMVYHPEHGVKMVPLEKAHEMYTQGWYDNPSKFPGNKLGTMKAKSREVA